MEISPLEEGACSAAEMTVATSARLTLPEIVSPCEASIVKSLSSLSVVRPVSDQKAHQYAYICCSANAIAQLMPLRGTWKSNVHAVNIFVQTAAYSKFL